MASPAENPFTALTIVVAPAILTNASSLLCFGTANRLARVMDRTRAVSAQLAGEGLNEGNRAMYQHQLRELEVRWNLILRALRCFYMSLGSFAAAALISLFGSMPVFSVLPVGFIAIALMALSSGHGRRWRSRCRKEALAGGQHRCYIIKDGFVGGKLHSQEVSH